MGLLRQWLLVTAGTLGHAVLYFEAGKALLHGHRNSTKMGYEHPILQYATSVVIQASLGNQTLALMPDTGSFDVLISSVLCEKCRSKRYRATESKTFKFESPMKTNTFHFGTGDVTALQAYDDFTAGPFFVPQMPVWLISGITPGLYAAFGTPEFDGLLGLGLSRSSAAEEMGIRSFSVCLQTFVSSWFSGGFLHWNGRDEHNFQWSTPMRSVDDFHWQLEPRQIKLGTHQVCNGPCSAVLDSGTSILAAPSSSALHLKRSLPEVPSNCSLEGLPSLVMQLTDGRELILSPASYVMKLQGNYDVFDSLASSGKIVWRRPAANSSNSTRSRTCVPMFQITSSGHWILGMPFIREYAVHFDRDAKTMSFATNKGGMCGSGSSFSAKKPNGNPSGIVEVDSTDLFQALKRRG